MKHYFYDLKKYLVFDLRGLDNEDGDLAILEKIKYTQVNKCLLTTQLYSYCEGELSKKNNDFRIFESDPKYLIVYESDSLQDCIDNLLLVINAKKYNL